MQNHEEHIQKTKLHYSSPILSKKIFPEYSCRNADLLFHWQKVTCSVPNCQCIPMPPILEKST